MNNNFDSDAIYYDYQAAVASLTRTSFDHDVWVPGHFAPAWSRTQQILPAFLSRQSIAVGVDPTVNDEAFKSILITLRQAFAVHIFNLVNPTSWEPAVGEYMRSIVVHGMCQALNFYVDSVVAIKKLSGENHLNSARLAHTCVHSALSLALLYLTRFVSMTDSVVICEQKIVFCSNAEIMTRLRRAYSDYEAFTAKSETLKYSRPILWTLYVGAWSERVQSLGTDQTQTKKQWFNSRFSAHAKKNGFNTWKEVREVLLGFFYNDNLSPNGSLWFQETLEDVNKTLPLRERV